MNASASYERAIEALYARGQELAPTANGAPRRKFDLAYMRILAEALDDPQSKFPSVLIAGTNGKGSTAATLASIGTASGYRTGLYTSPHLERVNERIRVGTELITDEDFARIFFRVDDIANHLVSESKLPHLPSFFEVMTAIAFVYFAEQQIDLAVLEVGLGGRLDATNIVEPVISVITDLGLDHTDWLGPTLTHIAKEKAGILRENGTMVTLPQHPEANYALGEIAVPLNVRGVNAAAYIPDRGLQHNNPLRNTYPVSILGRDTLIDSPLGGSHQQRNLALAIASAVDLRLHHGFEKISPESIAAGIAATQWPGRLEQIQTDGVPVLLDVAHNPDGAWTLRSAIAHLPESQPRTLLFSCLRDKAVTDIARILFPLFDSSSDRPQDHIVMAPMNNPRAASIEELQAAAAQLDIPVVIAADTTSALETAQRLTPANGLIIATGSVYLIGEVRSLLHRN